jgi:hypothetical protein
MTMNRPRLTVEMTTLNDEQLKTLRELLNPLASSRGIGAVPGAEFTVATGRITVDYLNAVCDQVESVGAKVRKFGFWSDAEPMPEKFEVAAVNEVNDRLAHESGASPASDDDA